ncbi:MAG: tetratricopeptide repeat protein [Bacteroidetes bacterium]|nr:tetratricopeptide repeat protein [Bacteroidota bacterium]
MNMKVVLFLALSLTSGLTFAQGKFITDAGIAINSSDFEEAKSAIEKAEAEIGKKESAGEKIEDKDLRKFWRYKEHIFLRLANNQPDTLLKQNYLSLSKEAALKYFEVDKSKYYETEVKEDMAALSVLYQNVGVEYFNKRDFVNASKMFEESIALNKACGKEDFKLYHNAAFSAIYAKNYDAAISYFNVLIANKYNDQNSLVTYKRKLVHAYSEQGNKEMALNKLTEFNSGDSINMDLLKEEIAILVEMNKTDDALKKMDQLVKMGYKDALTLENMGILYDQIGDSKKAIASYQAALQIDSSRANSYYGIGKVICLDYNTINQEINVLNKENENLQTVHPNKEQNKINANSKLVAEKEKAAIAKAQEALEYIEKALFYAPNDKDALTLAMQIYKNLGQKEKAAAVKERLSHL